jgi:Domain of unknown function (DUF4920)
MRFNVRIFSIIAVLAVASSAVAQEKAKRFGEPFTDAKKVKLADVMKNVEKYADKPIKIEGEIRDVCQNKGCWLVITDGESAMRVSFKAYSFFVPKDSAGKKVVLEGLVAKETIDEEEAKHYAEESKAKVDTSKIKGPQQVITMIASSVEIKEGK